MDFFLGSVTHDHHLVEVGCVVAKLHIQLCAASHPVFHLLHAHADKDQGAGRQRCDGVLSGFVGTGTGVGALDHYDSSGNRIAGSVRDDAGNSLLGMRGKSSCKQEHSHQQRPNCCNVWQWIAHRL